MATPDTVGIHHVTAISGDPRRNLAFYARDLGLRLVKKTVNFDDPSAYHLYYGDAGGTPGTILTFFPWADAPAGQPGAGELQETAFRIPRDSLDFWTNRLAAHGIARTDRFGQPVLTFRDPDGMRLALVGLPGIAAEPAWTTPDQDIPAEHAIRGFHGVTLTLADPAPTAAILSNVFAFTTTAQENGVHRFTTDATLGGIIDLRTAPTAQPPRLGRGSVHHLAFRAADDAAEFAMADKLAADHGLRTTEQKDRDYFRSVYFREPGGILFEIATDIPGFTVDEPADTLGTTLKLPRFLHPRRAQIEAALTPLA